MQLQVIFLFYGSKRVRMDIRVSAQEKHQAETLFESPGINVSTSICIFLMQSIRKQAVPFVITVNQPGPTSAYSLGEITSAFTNTVTAERSDGAAQGGLPIAAYTGAR